ncbi:ribosome maturation factor RimP [Nitrospina sp. 32_T5]|uniref:ribosome maturation factor RimP n=1 Tax=unclassified Nitrospina TaxID=2638683 RepID=UPI003F9570AB
MQTGNLAATGHTMSKGSIPQAVESLVEPVILAQGLELVDVEYRREGRNWILRIYIDKPGGVGVEDCKKVSRMVEDMIEVDDIVRTHYILEVSSPGLDRPLKKEKDFRRYLGKKVQITTYAPIGDRRNFKGTLKNFEDGDVHVDAQGQTFAIPLNNIASARLEIEFKL